MIRRIDHLRLLGAATTIIEEVKFGTEEDLKNEPEDEETEESVELEKLISCLDEALYQIQEAVSG